MSDHYFSEVQESADKRFNIEIKLKDDFFQVTSSSGIFSKSELDFATKLLIENSQIGKNILDLGCGYGVVGISILRKNKNVTVTFSDVNERAIDLTKDNLSNLSLKGIVVKSDLFNNLNSEFDTIISNPPYSAGRDLCFKLIEESFDHLVKDGTLQIVARHNKGGSTLSKKMKEIFGNVQTIARSGGFHVYLSLKND
ncbi:MAG: methyltransferase [Candidatus Woesearchaeota archaeon]|jgi:16S rRNA G1207 methylase RsmC